MNVDQMTALLESLNIEVLDIKGDEIQARCPAHKERTGKEDHNPSWFINANTGGHICFSCHFKGGLMYLIGYINKYFDYDGDVDFDLTRVWLSEQDSLTGLFERALDKKEHEPTSEPIDPALLHAFSFPPSMALRSRGLSGVACREYNLRWDDRRESWIIPIYRAIDGALMGWQEKSFRSRFFCNYPKGVKKSEALFGYGNTGSGPTIVVESPLDAVRLRSVGFNGVAVYGSYMSKAQINMIKSDEKIIFAFDNDQAGIDATQRTMALMQEMQFEGWFFDYSHTDQKDVGGMSRDEIVLGLENAKHFVALVAQGA